MALSRRQHELIEANQEMAGAIAISVWRQAPQAMELEELRSLALMGLVMAAERWPSYCDEKGYDPEATQYFAVFASRRMRGAIIDGVRSNDWAKRSLREKGKRLRDAEGATDEEIARNTGMTASEVRHAKAALEQRPMSLSEETVHASLPNGEHGAVEGSLVEQEVCRAVVEVLESLLDSHRTVVALHYYVGLELREVARQMGITESRASHLHTEAVLAVHGRLSEVMSATVR